MAGWGGLVDDVNMDRSSRVTRSQSGQALVETAILMPLFVFLMLGLLQLSLMNQARYMAKYAAYKAARVGSIHNASRQHMENAALAVLMPYVGTPISDTFYKTDGQVAFTAAYKIAQLANKRNSYTDHNIASAVEVMICDPITANVTGTPGDFDDPNSAMAVQDPKGISGDQAEWTHFNNGRLSIQVLFYFKLVIPFANQLIYSIASGLEDAQTMRLMRMTKKYNSMPKSTGGNESDLRKRALLKQYYLPIRANWSMRMMSNFLKKYPLPGSNACSIPFAKN